MMMLPLAKISIWWTMFAALWVLLALGLILVVLIQKGRGGGIGAAFGGGGANSLLGTKTGDFLTWVTISLISLFLVGAVVMGKYMRPSSDSGLAPSVTPIPEMPAPMQPALPDTETTVPTDVDVEDMTQAAQDAADDMDVPVESPVEQD